MRRAAHASVAAVAVATGAAAAVLAVAAAAVLAVAAAAVLAFVAAVVAAVCCHALQQQQLRLQRSDVFELEGEQRHHLARLAPLHLELLHLRAGVLRRCGAGQLGARHACARRRRSARRAGRRECGALPSSPIGMRAERCEAAAALAVRGGAAQDRGAHAPHAAQHLLLL